MLQRSSTCSDDVCFELLVVHGTCQEHRAVLTHPHTEALCLLQYGGRQNFKSSTAFLTPARAFLVCAITLVCLFYALATAFQGHILGTEVSPNKRSPKANDACHR